MLFSNQNRNMANQINLGQSFGKKPSETETCAFNIRQYYSQAPICCVNHMIQINDEH